MNEIQQWLDDEQRDYTIGVALYARYGKNKAMANTFSRGTSRFWMSKLTYELKKLSTLQSVVHTPRIVVKSEPTALHPHAPSQNGTDFVPQIIMSAKREISTLYAIIGKMHRELFELGTSNSDSVVKKRKELLEKRLPIITRADRLYVLKEEWFAGNTDVTEEIANMLSAPIEQQPSLELPAQTDVSALDDLKLAKRKTQLSSSITKTRNMLAFQSIRKGEQPMPMPEGPKRKEFEQKLKELQTEYATVLAELKKRSK